jgi:hypothetical protein
MVNVRAQSATEFMSQYAVAILIVAIMIGAFGYLFVSSQNSASFIASSCYISPQIVCYQTVVSSNGVGSMAYTYFTNQEQTSMLLSGYNITIKTATYSGSCNTTILSPGKSALCYSTITNFEPSPGLELNPTFYIKYALCNNLQCTGKPTPQTIATIGTATLSTVSNFKANINAP